MDSRLEAVPVGVIGNRNNRCVVEQDLCARIVLRDSVLRLNHWLYNAPTHQRPIVGRVTLHLPVNKTLMIGCGAFSKFTY